MANKTETKALDQCNSHWRDGTEDNRDWAQRHRRAMEFYFGNQWDPADLETLDSQGRAHMTLNKILSTVNLLSGSQRQNRTDFAVFARSNGSAKVAAALTELAKHAMDISHGDWEASHAFLEGIIGGKGWLGLDVDYSHDPINGDLLIEHIPALDVVEDREAIKYDLDKDARFVIRLRYKTLDELKLLYPRKAKEIDSGAALADLNSDQVQAGDYNPFDRRLRGGGYSDDAVQTDRRRQKAMVRHHWWKDWRRVPLLMNLETLQVQRIHPSRMEIARALVARGERDAAASGQPNPWRIQERVIAILMETVIAGDLVLEHREDPLGGLSRFPLTRFAPYHMDDNLMGIVHNLEEPQQEINKRRSQALHHLNQSANSGWISEEGAVADESVLEDFGSMPGVHIKVRPGRRLEKITPSPLSEGHIALERLANEDLQEISGVNQELRGLSERQESGRAIALKQRQGLTVSEVVFDNFGRSMEIFGGTLIELIRRGSANRISRLYSDSEIQAILSEANVDVNLEQLRDMATGRYAVKVTQRPSAPTARLANLELLLDMQRAGIPIPPDLIVDQSELPNKDVVKQRIQQALGVAQQQGPGNGPGRGSGGGPRGSPNLALVG